MKLRTRTPEQYQKLLRKHEIVQKDFLILAAAINRVIRNYDNLTPQQVRQVVMETVRLLLSESE